MIYIRKKTEPLELKQLQDEHANLSPPDAYNQLRNPLKSMVRESLLQEQGHLCAYCMCELTGDSSQTNHDNFLEERTQNVRIEHIIPRKPLDHRDIQQGLDYQNMLAVCNGNITLAPNDRTCDVHKRNFEFRKLHPCSPETLSSIYYDTEGSILARDPDIHYDLTEVLNLNSRNAPLKSIREALYIEITEIFLKAFESDPVEVRNWCETKLLQLFEEVDPKTPYLGLFAWIYEEKLSLYN